MIGSLQALAGDLENLLIALRKCGFDKTGIRQLTTIADRISRESARIGKQDIAELTEALSIILSDFIESPLTADCCIPIIQSTFKLSEKLNNLLSAEAISPESLPSHAFAWVFGLLDAHAMLAIADGNGLVTYANKPFCNVTGQPLSLLMGGAHPILADLQKDSGLIWQAILSGQIWQGETGHTTPDGRPYWVQSTLMPIKDDSGHITQYVSIHTDISAFKQVIAPSDTSLSKQSLGEDTALGCEMRTLLNTILGHSQLLLMQEGLDTEICGQLQEITQAGQKLTALLNAGMEQTSDPAAIATPPQASRQPPQKRLTHILVAEDDVANQAVLRMQLNVLGVKADIAKDGEEAWAYLQKHSYGLVLADLHMPQLDGLELACRIRLAEQGSDQHVPIIGISADHHPEAMAACHQAGMDGTLAKPIGLESLKSLLQTWLGETATLAAPLAVSTPMADSHCHYQPVLDIAYLANIVGLLEHDQVHSLLELFTTSARCDLNLCRQYILQKDTPALALIMHKLKSSAQSIGALRFASYAKNLEHAAQQGRLGKVVALITELDNALDDLEALLNDPLDIQIDVAPLPQPPTYQALVLDRDPENLRRLTRLLNTLGAQKVYAATDIGGALDVLQQPHQRINLLLYQLNMPDMEGMRLLDNLAALDYQGCIILLDGQDDERVLQTAVELAGKHGLHLLGSLSKPYARDALRTLMNESCGKMGEMAKKVSGQGLSPEDILEGLYHNEFEVFFQPKTDAFSLRPIGIEALARWRRQGVILPADAFILAAEHFNLIGQLSEMLLIKAFIGGARLAAMGLPLILSVNISSHWLADGELPDFIKASLQATRLPIENLVLEMGESVLIEDLEQSFSMLKRLHAKGFKLAVDKFSGDLPFDYLQEANISVLKLDRGLIRRATQLPTAQAFLSDLVANVSKHNFTSVAEGIETQTDLDLVRELGCDLVQGWFIGKAMPMDELVDWLHINKMF
jgi:PAS domain S-box-containing protein